MYDVRWARDSLNPAGQCNVMVRAPSDMGFDHPCWYARILGVFHTQVLCIPQVHCDPRIPTLHEPRLWVRWCGNESDYVSGSQAARLHKIEFVPSHDQGAFGFLDPSLIVRACHLIPPFSDSKTNLLLCQGPSAGDQLKKSSTEQIFTLEGVWNLLKEYIHALIMLLKFCR